VFLGRLRTGIRGTLRTCSICFMPVKYKTNYKISNDLHKLRSCHLGFQILHLIVIFQPFWFGLYFLISSSYFCAPVTVQVPAPRTHALIPITTSVRPNANLETMTVWTDNLAKSLQRAVMTYGSQLINNYTSWWGWTSLYSNYGDWALGIGIYILPLPLIGIGASRWCHWLAFLLATLPEWALGIGIYVLPVPCIAIGASHWRFAFLLATFLLGTLFGVFENLLVRVRSKVFSPSWVFQNRLVEFSQIA